MGLPFWWDSEGTRPDDSPGQLQSQGRTRMRPLTPGFRCLQSPPAPPPGRVPNRSGDHMSGSSQPSPSTRANGREVGGGKQRGVRAKQAWQFPEAAAMLMMPEMEPRSVKGILMDMTSLITIFAWKGPPLGRAADRMLTAEICLLPGTNRASAASFLLI